MPSPGLSHSRIVVKAYKRVPQSVVDMRAGRWVLCAVCVGERTGGGCDDVSSYPGYCAVVGRVGVVRAK